MRHNGRKSCAGPTVDRALELLAADLAVKLADTLLLVKLDGDGILVVAKQAGKNCGERLVLHREFSKLRDAIRENEGLCWFSTYLPRALRLSRALLAFSHCDEKARACARRIREKSGWRLQIRKCPAGEFGLESPGIGALGIVVSQKRGFRKVLVAEAQAFVRVPFSLT